MYDFCLVEKNEPLDSSFASLDEKSGPLALANSLAACVLSSKLNPSERQWAAYQLVGERQRYLEDSCIVIYSIILRRR